MFPKPVHKVCLNQSQFQSSEHVKNMYETIRYGKLEFTGQYVRNPTDEPANQFVING